MTTSYVPETSSCTGHVSKLLRRHDRAALDELLEWYRPLLKAIAERELDTLLRPKLDASDVVQETCQDVVRGFSQVQARRSFQFWSYLRTTLRHKLDNARRKFKHSKKRSVYREQAINDGSGRASAPLLDFEPQPLDHLINDETCEQVRTLLVRLPPELQRVLRWRFSKNMTYKEIGDKIHRSEDDVRMLIRRCLARIRVEVLLNEPSS